jgi:hypothetical protein
MTDDVRCNYAVNTLMANPNFIFRISPEDKEEIRRIANKRRVPMSDLVKFIVFRHLAEYDRDPEVVGR